MHRKSVWLILSLVLCSLTVLSVVVFQKRAYDAEVSRQAELRQREQRLSNSLRQEYEQRLAIEQARLKNEQRLQQQAFEREQRRLEAEYRLQIDNERRAAYALQQSQNSASVPIAPTSHSQAGGVQESYQQIPAPTNTEAIPLGYNSPEITPDERTRTLLAQRQQRERERADFEKRFFDRLQSQARQRELNQRLRNSALGGGGAAAARIEYRKVNGILYKQLPNGQWMQVNGIR